MTDMSYLFCGDKSHSRYVPGAETFNGDISKWNVGLVTTMYAMFQGAAAFDRDISKWDVGRVTDMRWMFYNAKAFDQTLCGVWLSSTASKSQMFTGSPGKIGTATTCRRAFPLPVSVHARLRNRAREHSSWFCCVEVATMAVAPSCVRSPLKRAHENTHAHTNKHTRREREKIRERERQRGRARAKGRGEREVE